MIFSYHLLLGSTVLHCVVMQTIYHISFQFIFEWWDMIVKALALLCTIYSFLELNFEIQFKNITKFCLGWALNDFEEKESVSHFFPLSLSSNPFFNGADLFWHHSFYFFKSCYRIIKPKSRVGEGKVKLKR